MRTALVMKHLICCKLLQVLITDLILSKRNKQTEKPQQNKKEYGNILVTNTNIVSITKLSLQKPNDAI